MSWATFLFIFFLAHVKFIFTPSIAIATFNELSFYQIFLPTVFGALFCFNFFFWISKRLMLIAKARRIRINLKNKKKTKKYFSKRNKWIIKIKQSKMGLVLICFLAPLFLSIPIGTIIVVKFYGNRLRAYLTVSISLIIATFLLTWLNDFIINIIR